jgi:hypothetical protein
VPTRRAAVGQNLIVVDGRYGSSTAGEEVWTGGPGWNQAGLDSSAVTLQVLDASVTQAYLDAFTRAWQSA